MSTEIDPTETVEPDEAAIALAKQARREEYKELAKQGLWKNNPGLVQLLGLCPLLAVTATVIGACYLIGTGVLKCDGISYSTLGS
jgi:electron transport complex protein RnfE